MWSVCSNEMAVLDNRAPPKLRTRYPPASGQGDELRSQTLEKQKQFLPGRRRRYFLTFLAMPRLAITSDAHLNAWAFRRDNRSCPVAPGISHKPGVPVLHSLAHIYQLLTIHQSFLLFATIGMNDSAGTMADVAQKIKMQASL